MAEKARIQKYIYVRKLFFEKKTVFKKKLWKTDFFRNREGQVWSDDVKAKWCKSRQHLKRSVEREKSGRAS